MSLETWSWALSPLPPAGSEPSPPHTELIGRPELSPAAMTTAPPHKDGIVACDRWRGLGAGEVTKELWLKQRLGWGGREGTDSSQGEQQGHTPGQTAQGPVQTSLNLPK